MAQVICRLEASQRWRNPDNILWIHNSLDYLEYNYVKRCEFEFWKLIRVQLPTTQSVNQS